MGATNCPETPRQKMIGMMYLVLLAMLAMNVAIEVLHAFRLVDSSLYQSYLAIERKSDQQYNTIYNASQADSVKVGPTLKMADDVRDEIDKLQKYVADLKVELVVKGGGKKISEIEGYTYNPELSYIVNYEGDSILVNKDDDLNIPSELLIRLGKATEMRQKIAETRANLTKIIESHKDFHKQDSLIVQTINQSLSTPDPPKVKNDSEGNQTWETQNFSHQPMIAAITLISKVQIDIANTEASVLSWLHSKIDAGSYKFNKLNPVVISRSSAILEGGTYEAQVFLAAEDTTQKPMVFVGGRELPVDGGKASYKASASRAGTYTWGGEIHFKGPDGEVQKFTFDSEYQVVSPSATISPTKMNVLYMNIANPISVSVPGVASKDVTVTMTNGRVTEQGGSMVVFPGKEDPTGKITKINVDVNLAGGGTKRVASTEFRVKRVPDPVAQIGGKNGGVIRKEELLAEQGIYAALINFDFDLRFRVTGFNATLSGAGGFNNTYSSNSAVFTAEMQQQFRAQQAGSIIYFDNIVAKGDDNTTRNLPPISFKIR